jgi:hypothetical protein
LTSAYPWAYIRGEREVIPMIRRTKDGDLVEFDAQAEALRAQMIANGAPESEVNDYVACELQREEDIKAGRPYYDYEAQEWRNV